jgi:hypothetical protein
MGESTITEKKNKNTNRRMTGFSWERIQSIIIVILFIVILLMRQCGGKKVEPVKEKIVTKVEIVRDTVELEKTVYVPKWRTKIETKYDTTFVDVPAHVDTLNILKDYYSKYEYTDTLYLDSLGYVILTDTISQNTILKRSQVPSIVIPTKIVNNTIFINNREFYTGFGVRTNGKNISWMGLEGVLKNKKGNTFVLGIGTDNENKFSLGGSVHWKIGNE